MLWGYIWHICEKLFRGILLVNFGWAVMKFKRILHGTRYFMVLPVVIAIKNYCILSKRAHLFSLLKTTKFALNPLYVCDTINSVFWRFNYFLLTLYLPLLFLSILQLSSTQFQPLVFHIFSNTNWNEINWNVSRYPTLKSKVASSTWNCVSRGDAYFSLETNDLLNFYGNSTRQGIFDWYIFISLVSSLWKLYHEFEPVRQSSCFCGSVIGTRITLEYRTCCFCHLFTIFVIPVMCANVGHPAPSH